MRFSFNYCFRQTRIQTVIGLIGTGILISVPVGAHKPSAILSRKTSEPLLSNWLSQAPSPNLNQSSQHSAWQSFTSASGRYAVDFPALPTQFTSTTEVPEGTLTWQVAETRLNGANLGSTSSYEYYMIAYTTLSSDNLVNRNPNELVQTVSDAVLSEGGLNETIQLKEPVLFHNHPAQLVIGLAKNQYWAMIVSLVDGRLYTNLGSVLKPEARIEIAVFER
jgi:hypothetical protein